MTSLALFGIFRGLKPVTYAPLRLSPLEGMPEPISVGDRFGLLKVKRLDTQTDSRGNRFFWICRCKCKRLVAVHGNTLRSGMTRSCGAACPIPKPRKS